MGQQEASGKKSNWKFNTKECLAFKSRREEEKLFLKEKISWKCSKRRSTDVEKRAARRKEGKKKVWVRKATTKKSDREDQQYSTPTRISKNTIEYFSYSFLDFFLFFYFLDSARTDSTKTFNRAVPEFSFSRFYVTELKRRK